MNCSYCIVNKTLGKRPVFNKVHWTNWIWLLRRVKPRIVTFSGGEPFLYEGIENLINHLTKRMIFVTVSTNLMALNLDIRPSKFLWFYATNHKSNTKLFKRNLKIYKKFGYNVSVSEFGFQEIKGSHKKELKEKQTTKEIEIYAPDMRKFNSWIELEKHGV